MCQYVDFGVCNISNQPQIHFGETDRNRHICLQATSAHIFTYSSICSCVLCWVILQYLITKCMGKTNNNLEMVRIYKAHGVDEGRFLKMKFEILMQTQSNVIKEAIKLKAAIQIAI